MLMNRKNYIRFYRTYILSCESSFQPSHHLQGSTWTKMNENIVHSLLWFRESMPGTNNTYHDLSWVTYGSSDTEHSGQKRSQQHPFKDPCKAYSSYKRNSQACSRLAFLHSWHMGRGQPWVKALSPIVSLDMQNMYRNSLNKRLFWIEAGLG